MTLGLGVPAAAGALLALFLLPSAPDAARSLPPVLGAPVTAVVLAATAEEAGEGETDPTAPHRLAGSPAGEGRDRPGRPVDAEPAPDAPSAAPVRVAHPVPPPPVAPEAIAPARPRVPEVTDPDVLAEGSRQYLGTRPNTRFTELGTHLVPLGTGLALMGVGLGCIAVRLRR
ncbi:hypothetical protein ACN20G_12715 [Streptomyces sp. BI20]|uniref:hypothetical protein n=1 Tax=Streptomyces sp. BI20 TaxID=3403460 RepID=UPI003C72962C